MKLGFHYHVPAVAKGKDIYTSGSQGVFLDSLAPFFESIICFLHSPRENEEQQCDYLIRSKNIELVNIGLHASVPIRFIRSKKFSSSIKNRKNELDVLLLRGPSPLLPAMAKRATGIPIVLLLVASYKDGLDILPQPTWRKALIRLWAHWNETQQLIIAKRSLTFVNSRKLYDDLKPKVSNLVETRTSTLKESDFYFRADTCQSMPYQLLFVGRIAAEKGLLDMIKALALLQKLQIDVVLNLVGAPDQAKFLDQLFHAASDYHVENRIVYHGYKSLGADLFSLYRTADIFMIASQSSFEGFPRVIWEAFSHSLPVIATRVGSIPYYLRNEEDALLTIPNKPDMLADCVKRLINEPELRQRLIRNGVKLAKSNTLDIRAKEMSEKMKTWISKKSYR